MPREETIVAFVEMYRTLGYEPCATNALEAGYEKIALYVNALGEPTHAARQLTDGTWTSKLGPLEDIGHETLDCLNGPLYGSALFFLQRSLSASD